MRGGMGGLNEHAFGPPIAFVGAATLFFARRFMLARTNADPGSGMGGIWEVVHVPAQLAQQDFDTSERVARHRIDAFDEGIEPAQAVGDLSVEAGNRVI
jgi:hypothetical protein